MKIRKSKLRLDRESVVSLQADALDGVNGGVMYTGCDSACTKCGGPNNPLTRPRPEPPMTRSIVGGCDLGGVAGTAAGTRNTRPW
jgi:hypothetical protein